MFLLVFAIFYSERRLVDVLAQWEAFVWLCFSRCLGLFRLWRVYWRTWTNKQHEWWSKKIDVSSCLKHVVLARCIVTKCVSYDVKHDISQEWNQKYWHLSLCHSILVCSMSVAKLVLANWRTVFVWHCNERLLWCLRPGIVIWVEALFRNQVRHSVLPTVFLLNVPAMILKNNSQDWNEKNCHLSFCNVFFTEE